MSFFDGQETKEIEPIERSDVEKNFFWKKKIPIEEYMELQDEAHRIGILHLEADRLNPNATRTFLKTLEKMQNEGLVEKGDVTAMVQDRLKPGVHACTGPYRERTGEYEGAVIRLSESQYKKKTYEWADVDMESDLNIWGQRWFAGRGTEGVFVHEIAHAAALRMNAEDAGIELGDVAPEKYNDLLEKYNRNSRIVSVCYGAMKDLEISPRDVGKILSTYAESSFGEMWSEAMAQYYTQKHPSELSIRIHDRFMELKEQQRAEKAS